MISHRRHVRLVQRIRSVGRYQLSVFRSGDGGTEKVAKEYVSEVDVRSEQMLRRACHSAAEAATFFGEETGRSRSALEWVVDPLDGTTNYLAGLDDFSISVALVENERPVYGIVYKPWTGELFVANGVATYSDPSGAVNRLPAAPRRSPADALIGTGFPYRSPSSRTQFHRCVDEVLDSTRGIRRCGSAALDLCRLGVGFLQGFWEVDLQPYDVAAAIALLDIVGCSYSEFSGEAYRLFDSTTLVAGLPGVYEPLSAIVGRAYS